MKHKTAIVGFGQIAAGYQRDVQMARLFKYSTHAQVLSEHPSFQWTSVIDPSSDSLSRAVDEWHVKDVATEVTELANREQIQLAVIATPPQFRTDCLEGFPGLRAVLVEKPLGTCLEDSNRFLNACASRKIAVQVNLVRRAETTLRALADGGLRASIGAPKACTGYYGNGLLNNGTHLVDLVRMLVGEVEWVVAVPGASGFAESPIPLDSNFAVSLILSDGLLCNLQPLPYANYREFSLDIWGENGRISIAQSGLRIMEYQRRRHRAIADASEVASDDPHVRSTQLGTALYDMYSNLAAHIENGTPLFSPGDSALRTAAVVEAAFKSREQGGIQVAPSSLLSACAEVAVKL